MKAADLWQALRKAQRILTIGPEALKVLLEECQVLDAYCGIQLAIHCATRDIGHIHAHFASSAASVARIASSLLGIPYTITAHAKDIFHESVQHVDLLQKLSGAAATFTVSEFNLRYLRSEYAEASERVVRLYNGMHLSDFPYQSPEQRSNTIVAVGRFVEKKGFEDLILACHELQQRGVDFRCQLVGGGELEEKLSGMVLQCGLQARVQLMGPQPQRQVKEFIQSAAVMACPCVHGQDGNRDGLPTVLLESMALGTPCVSTAVTGIPEVIRHGQTGLIVPERSPRELADALLLLLETPTMRTRLAAAARALIEQEFDVVQNTAVQRAYFGHHPLKITNETQGCLV